ncbi:hypothetical protein AZZ74_001587 [Klebsiella pneumoniae]|nr:hypothetical protein AZZ74_001587 [Klebsiella pneumoniae]
MLDALDSLLIILVTFTVFMYSIFTLETVR